MPELPKSEDDLRELMAEHLRMRQEIDRLLQQKDQKPKEEDKKEPEKEQKPPLRERARNWAKAHPLGVLLLVVGLVAVLVAGYFLWRYLQSYESTDDAEVDGHIHQISSRIAGTVVGVYVENDRSVVPSQTLLTLDPRDYEAALTQARARLSQAQAELAAQSPNVPITATTQASNVAAARLETANAAAALEAARQTYAAALADLRQAEANRDNAAAEERRYRSLVAKDEVSREQYDQKLAAARAQEALVASRRDSADAAAKAVDQRRAALDEARTRQRAAEANQPREVAAQRSTVETRKASVAAASAEVEQARLNLSYCTILAPAAGIVGEKNVEVGQRISPGEDLLAVTGVDDLWVTANFKETQIARMRPGQSVQIHVDALDRDFEGYVQNLPGATGARFSLLPPENATGNYVKVVQRMPVRIRFRPNQPALDRLRPGMSVEPKVWLE
jgi:membrane fusion protein (multidrug efflux system)